MDDSASADKRTRRQKMLDMAQQTVASPREAAIAQAWLAAHPVEKLTREKILESSDRAAPTRRVRYYDHRLNAWVVMEVDAAYVNRTYPSTTTTTSGGASFTWSNRPTSDT